MTLRNGRPTIAKHQQLIPLAYCDLRKQRKQVVGYALRVFAHQAAWVRAGRVEVAQQCRVPVVSRLALRLEVVALGFDMVGDAGFNGGFCAAVGVGGTDGAFFGDRDHVGEASRVAIDGGGGGEDDVGDIVLCHGGEEANGAVDIGAIVLQRDLTRFADCLRFISKLSQSSGVSCWLLLASMPLSRTLRAAKWITLSIFGCASKTLSKAAASVMSTL